MVFWPCCHKQGILASVLNSFKTCLKQGMVLRARQPLSFLRLGPGPCEKLKELAIVRRTSDAFLFPICILSTE